MIKNIYIDITGLSYKYQSGVQNTLWSFIEAACSEEIRECYKIIFYDCSGQINSKIFQNELINYQNHVNSTNPFISKSIKFLYDYKLLTFSFISHEDSINHVWNWGIKSNLNIPNSITVHDLFPLEFPDLFNFKMQKLTQKSVQFAIDKCSQIQSVSKHTKNQLINYTSINPDAISVVYPAINSYYFTEPVYDKELLNNFNLKSKNYFISIGYLDPRKNLVNQIKAFKVFISKNNSNIKYALTGFENSFSKEILQLLDDPILKGKVIFLGFISIEKLKFLLINSIALLYCSIAEGFGIPIIEAFACRANVITSNSSSMKELAEGRGILVNPNSIDEIYLAMIKTIENNYEVQKESNFIYAANFTSLNWFKGHFAKKEYELPS